FWHDDFQTQYLPGLREVARAWSEGTFPLLTTASWHSTALAGELQYGVFSLFGTLVDLIAWSLHLSLANTAMFLSAAHLAAAAVGAALASPALLVHVDYLTATTRAAGTTAQQSWSVPLIAFIGAVYPTFRTIWNGWYSTTQHSVTELAGAFVPLVGLIAALL